jgi:SAM-dependent methyltransferase
MRLRTATPGTPDHSPIPPEVSSQAEALTLRMVGWHRRVLEIGSGLTRALRDRGCKVTTVTRDPGAVTDLQGIAAEVVVGDANDPGTLARLAPDFDVVIVGSMFTWVGDPQALFDTVAELISPRGRVVLALPNIGHADIKLARLGGRFDHVSATDQPQAIFTLEGIREMTERAGLAIVDLMRVRIPAFETGLGIDRLTVPTATLTQILAEPEAETHQFVFTAVRDDAHCQIARLFLRCEQMQADAERQLISAAARSIEIEALKRERQAARAELDRQTLGTAEALSQVETLAADLQELRSTVSRTAEALRDTTERSRHMHDTLVAEQTGRAAAEAELAALRATRVFRYSKWPRAIYSALFRKRR